MHFYEQNKDKNEGVCIINVTHNNLVNKIKMNHYFFGLKKKVILISLKTPNSTKNIQNVCGAYLVRRV